jgi:hypothetical protein
VALFVITVRRLERTKAFNIPHNSSGVRRTGARSQMALRLLPWPWTCNPARGSDVKQAQRIVLRYIYQAFHPTLYRDAIYNILPPQPYRITIHLTVQNNCVPAFGMPLRDRCNHVCFNVVEHGCWRINAVSEGQDHSDDPGMRPAEFRILLDEILFDRLPRNAKKFRRSPRVHRCDNSAVQVRNEGEVPCEEPILVPRGGI